MLSYIIYTLSYINFLCMHQSKYVATLSYPITLLEAVTVKLQDLVLCYTMYENSVLTCARKS